MSSIIFALIRGLQGLQVKPIELLLSQEHYNSLHDEMISYIEDPVSCPTCGAEMYRFRGAPHPGPTSSVLRRPIDIRCPKCKTRIRSDRILGIPIRVYDEFSLPVYVLPGRRFLTISLTRPTVDDDDEAGDDSEG